MLGCSNRRVADEFRGEPHGAAVKSRKVVFKEGRAPWEAVSPMRASSSVMKLNVTEEPLGTDELSHEASTSAFMKRQ